MKMRVALLGLSLTLAAALPIKALADTDVSGNYKCSGTDPFQKSNYSSDLSVTKLGETYSFRWGQNGKDFGGTGIIHKASPNTVSAEFWSPNNNNNSGVIVYQIQPDGTLEGSWAIADQALVGTEICKKAPSE